MKGRFPGRSECMMCINTYSLVERVCVEYPSYILSAICIQTTFFIPDIVVLLTVLGYLVNMTRSDLVFAYSELRQYVQFPGKLQMTVVNHVLRYLRVTFDKGILCSRGRKQVNILWGWVDTDWSVDTDTHRSHTGFVLILKDGPISWKSRRQDSVTLSTRDDAPHVWL